MDVAGIREAITRQPFLPFELRLADGRSLPVRHPDFIMISPNNRRVIVFTPPDDAMSIVEPLLVVSIEHAGAPAGGNSGGNGDMSA